MLLALSLLFIQDPPIAPFVDQLRNAVTSGNRQRVEGQFLNTKDSEYLFRMANDRGGLRTLKVAVIPSPPGWENTGKFWAIIHTRQDIEDHHDPVYPIIVSDSRFKLGPEIPEDATLGVSIPDMKINAHVMPATNSVSVQASFGWKVDRLTRAPLLRLNDNFVLDRAIITEGNAPIIDANSSIPKPTEGSIVRAGSLMIPWTKTALSQGVFDYYATVNNATEDKITAKACYLTAWWVPTLGRSPFTTSTRVQGPAAWVIQSEGNRIKKDESAVTGWPSPPAGEKEEFFRCEIPISYPKVIGGSYLLAAQKKVGERTYSIFHFDPIDKTRADKDLQTIADAIAWYDEHLVPFPFNEYSCYDADTYYGIESYNYTLLQSGITSWAVGHEAGHTYFGGLVPSAYVHDSWNESMTQYVDSVLRQNNADHTLEAAASSINLHVPLTEMPVAHEYSNATYYRGAYVLRMLENQIGLPAMYGAIKSLIKDRRGKDTTWYDLRPYFERASGKKLDWFWQQWVSGATFPTLTITDAQGIPHPKGTKVFITVRQRGVQTPYRLKFRVWTKSNSGKEASQAVEMTSPEASFELNLGDAKAYEAGIDTLGYVLSPKIASKTVRF